MNWVVGFGPVKVAPRSTVRVATKPKIRFTPVRFDSSTTSVPVPDKTFEPEEEIAFQISNETDETMVWSAQLRGRSS